MKLYPEVKALWVEKLRSGEYPQGRSVLCRNDYYCCLGVLSDISPVERKYDSMTDAFTWDDNAFGLGRGVQEWAGVDTDQITIEISDEDLRLVQEYSYKLDCYSSGPNVVSLAGLNDAGVPFTVIADIIEKYL